MIIVGKTVLSDDIADKFFVCHIQKCKGACCIEGDLGAPLNKNERHILEAEYEKIKPYLSLEGQQAIQEKGLFVQDSEGDFSTSLLESGLCAYAIQKNDGSLSCGIEQAFLDKKTDFRKPISCHLYPIRIQEYGEFDAVNYHRWDICQAACALGEKLGVPLYQFLKDALIRNYGQEWYEELEKEIAQRTTPPPQK